MARALRKLRGSSHADRDLVRQMHKMSLESSPEPSRRSPKRKRSDPDVYSGARYGEAGDAALSYAYDDDLTSDAENAFNTPDNGSDDEATRPKRRKLMLERPQRLNYIQHLTLRGHKRGVAAVKFSPDGKWIASCCEDDNEEIEYGRC